MSILVEMAGLKENSPPSFLRSENEGGARGGRRSKHTAKKNVRELVERLEAVYGQGDQSARFEPMDELISCILTQHSTDKTAFAVFDELRKKIPTWQQLSSMSPEKLAPLIRRAGLANQKARSIIESLNEIKRRNNDYTLENLRGMPMKEARAWLTSLPGVGPKTASIVLCFAFGQGAIPVDTHVFRVAWRLGLVPKGAGEAKAHDLLLEIVPAELAFRFHVALIRHGRQTCKAPLPLCEKCAVTDLCAWFKSGGPQKRIKELSARRSGSKPKGVGRFSVRTKRSKMRAGDRVQGRGGRRQG